MASSGTNPGSNPATGSDRLPNWVFALALLVAAPTIMWTNRNQWFFLDDWDFLATRNIFSFNDLMRPHNEHWTTVPIIIYRLIYQVVGINHYWPYQILVVLAHLVAATLLRIVVKRAGVDPWLATAGAVLFLFFGAGRYNLAVAFQITFTGSLAFGLAHLVLADHDGPLDRRDLWAAGCGLLALMCSGIGVTTVFVVGVSVLIRRGWRPALAHTLPLAAIYGAWFLSFGHTGLQPARTTPRQLVTFSSWQLRDTLFGLGQSTAGAIVMGVLVLIAVETIANARNVRLRKELAPVVAMGVGIAALIAVTGWRRGAIQTVFQPPGPGTTPDRYVHLTAALMLPAVLVGASVIVRRWRWTLLPIIPVLLIGLPGNVEAVGPSGQARLALGNPARVSLLADEAMRMRSPRSLEPDPAMIGLTVGWLIDARKAGRIPETSAADQASRETARLLLSFQNVDEVPAEPCRPVKPATEVRVNKGQALRVLHYEVRVFEVEKGRSIGSVTYRVRATPQEVLSGSAKHKTLSLRVLRTMTIQLDESGPPGSISVCG